MLRENESLQRAEAVLALVKVLSNRYDDSKDWTMYSGITAGVSTGFHFFHGLNDRAINVLGDKVSDGFRTVRGFLKDFDGYTGLGKDSTVIHVFDRSQVFECAWFVVDWLYNPYSFNSAPEITTTHHERDNPNVQIWQSMLDQGVAKEHIVDQVMKHLKAFEQYPQTEEFLQAKRDIELFIQNIR